MGDSKIGRNELAEFARQTAEFLEPFQRRQRALEVCFDVLVTSLGPEVAAKVKAELERRATAMKGANEIPKTVAEGEKETGASVLPMGLPGDRRIVDGDDERTAAPVFVVAPEKP